MQPSRSARPTLRQGGLALGVFIMTALPFHLVCAEPFTDLVMAGARAIVTLAGPPRDRAATDRGEVVVDRHAAFDEFFDDPAQRPRPYGVLALWSVIAVAPVRARWQRLWTAVVGTVTLAVVYASARACSVLAWYHSELARLTESTSAAGPLLDAVGSFGTSAALVIVPIAFGSLALATATKNHAPD